MVQVEFNEAEQQLIKDALGFYGHYCSSITWVTGLAAPHCAIPEDWRKEVHANGGKAYTLLDRIRRNEIEQQSAKK